MKKAGTLAIFLSLVSGTAVANPRARFVKFFGSSEGPHVRLTNKGNYYLPSPDRVAKGEGPVPTFHGTSQSPWVTTGSSESGDTGSGVETWEDQTMCDCHVPAGATLTYKLEYTDYGAVTVSVPAAPTDSADCETECAEADALAAANRRDSGAGGQTGSASAVATQTKTATGTASKTSDAGPSDPGTGGGGQGVSATAIATQTKTATGTASKTSDAGAASESGSGARGACTFGSSGAGGALSVLVALGLGAFVVRRRR